MAYREKERIFCKKKETNFILYFIKTSVLKPLTETILIIFYHLKLFLPEKKINTNNVFIMFRILLAEDIIEQWVPISDG